MVKTNITSTHAKINRELTKTMIDDVFGRTLTLRRYTRTLDSFGQVSVATTADTTFIGDLQFGLDIDERLIKTGMVDVGDGVLYIHPEALAVTPVPEDIIVDGNSRWEILQQIEAPELGGTVCHYSYRCKRRIEANDS